MATTLAKVKRNGPTTEAALDALLVARQWGYADDTRRLSVMEAGGVTIRRFWDSTRLSDQTATYGTALIGTQGITGVTPTGGSSGAAATLQAMLGGLANANTNYIFNQTGVQASSNFNISGAGVIGTTLSVAGVVTVTGVSAFAGAAIISSRSFQIGGGAVSTQGSGVNQYGLVVDPLAGTDSSSSYHGMYLVGQANGSVTSLYSQYIDTNNKTGGTVTNNYALYIANQTVGASNWAIKTGTGLVDFGDNVLIAGTLGVTGVATFTAAPVFSSATASTAAAFDASKNLVSVTNTGTGNNVLSASPTLTGTIAAASQTLSGTLGVTGTTRLTGNVGVGTSAATNIGIYVSHSALTSTSQYGAWINPFYTSASTLETASLILSGNTNASAYTTANMRLLYILDGGKGAGSTITNLYGIQIASITQGASNWAIKTGTGLVDFGDNVLIAGTLGVGGITTLGNTLRRAVAGEFLISHADGGNLKLHTTSGDIIFQSSDNIYLTTGASDKVIVSNALDVAGNFAINGSYFTVNAGNGNAIVGGTLGVTGDASFSAKIRASQGNFIIENFRSGGGSIQLLTANGGIVLQPSVNSDIALLASGTGIVSVGSTVDATSIATGGLNVAGGIGIGKRLCLDGATGKTLRIVNGVANSSVLVTFPAATGPTGSTAGAPQGWMRIDVNGTDRYIPYW